MYTKSNLENYFPQPYEQEIWNYGQGNTELIRRAVHEFNLQRAFSNLDINERGSFFNETILNIVSNFMPHETIICDDKDRPGINTRTKKLISTEAY